MSNGGFSPCVPQTQDTLLLKKGFPLCLPLDDQHHLLGDLIIGHTQVGLPFYKMRTSMRGILCRVAMDVGGMDGSSTSSADIILLPFTRQNTRSPTHVTDLFASNIEQQHEGRKKNRKDLISPI